MKKLITLIAGLLWVVAASSQTFPVNNLVVNGTSQFTGQGNFTLSPTAPTPTAGDSSTKLATTAFVSGAVATASPAVANNTVLAATSTVFAPTVWRMGFVAAGDAPPLLYVATALPCTLNAGAGDNGSQVKGSNGNCWNASFGPGPADVREWGAKADGSTNNTAAMQAAHATGRLIYYPQGQYNFTTISFSSGGIIGDGYFTILNTTDTGSTDAITYTGGGSGNAAPIPTFQNFAEVAQNTRSGGAGLHFAPSAGNLQNLHVNNIWQYGFYRGIQLTNCEYGSIAEATIVNYFDVGIYYEFPQNTGAGDFVIANSHLATAETTGRLIGIYQLSGGGLRITGDKILGGHSGFVLAYTGAITSGPLLLTGNSIENQDQFNIYLGVASTGAFGGIVITGNELGVNNGASGTDLSTDTSGLLSYITVSGNYMQFNGATGTGVAFTGVQGFTFGSNSIIGNGQSGNVGMQINSSGAGKIAAQNFLSIPTNANHYVVSSSPTVTYYGDTETFTTGTITTSTAYGSLFSGSISVTFPRAFTTVPNVTCSNNSTASGGVAVFPQSISGTGFTAVGISTNSGGSAIGQCTANGIL